jgi:hypothetical protein
MIKWGTSDIPINAPRNCFVNDMPSQRQIELQEVGLVLQRCTLQFLAHMQHINNDIVVPNMRKSDGYRGTVSTLAAVCLSDNVVTKRHITLIWYSVLCSKDDHHTK